MGKLKEKLEILEALDFNQIFRVKGRQGLFLARANPSKSGIWPVVNFNDNKIKHYAKISDCVVLGQLVFKTLVGHEDLKIIDVFKNVLKTKKAALDMSLMVPEYDCDEFKNYHADQVAKFWSEIELKINNIISDAK
jgi:hypothetical protein